MTSVLHEIENAALTVATDHYWFCENLPDHNLAMFLRSYEGTQQTVIFHVRSENDLDFGKYNCVGPYKLFELRVPKPFNMPGLIADVTSTVAEIGYPVLVYSAFRSDFFFVRVADSEQVEIAIRGKMK